MIHKVSLFDEVEVSLRGRPGVELCCPEVPGPDNLALRAARALLPPDLGATVRVHKRIPLMAGLGGGSSDAAATLRALGELLGRPPQRLRPLAEGLGSDVPLFLEPSPAVLVRGRGEVVEPLPRRVRPWYLIVLPPVRISTPWAYARWDEERGVALTAPRPPDIDVRGLLCGWEALTAALHNDLERPVAAHHPEVLRARRWLEEAGALAAAMSGSGAAVFGVFKELRAAREAQSRLRGGPWRSWLVRGL